MRRDHTRVFPSVVLSVTHLVTTPGWLFVRYGTPWCRWEPHLRWGEEDRQRGATGRHETKRNEAKARRGAQKQRWRVQWYQDVPHGWHANASIASTVATFRCPAVGRDGGIATCWGPTGRGALVCYRISH